MTREWMSLYQNLYQSLVESLQAEVFRLKEKDKITVRYMYDFFELKTAYRQLEEDKEKMEIEYLEKIFTLTLRVKKMESQL